MSINYFIRPKWSTNFENLVCGYTLPEHGNMALTRKSISSGKTTEENRIKLSNLLNFDINNFFLPHQVHSDKVILVNEDNKGKGVYSLENAIEGDACVTNKKNILLMITWADCIPILMYDPKNEIIGAVHSGWKGTKQNIFKKTLDTMKSLGSQEKDIYVSIGPGIRSCCYKVGKEFQLYFSGNHNFFSLKKNDLYFDLAGYINDIVLSNGIDINKNDFYSKCNSCCKTPVFFSCRKDGNDKFEGQGAFIALR
jgi:polyphenol oxidase